MRSNANFVSVNVQITENLKDFKGSSLKVAIYLLDKVPRVFPKVCTIAKDCGLSRATVFRALKLLKEKRVIKTERFYRQSNVYRFNPDLLRGKLRLMHRQFSDTMSSHKRHIAKILGRRFYDAGRVSKCDPHNKNKETKKDRYMSFSFKNRNKGYGLVPLASVI